MDRTLRIVARSPVIDVVFASPMLGRGPGMPRGPFPAPDPVDDLPPAEIARRVSKAVTRAAEQLARLQDETGVPFVALMRERALSGAGSEAAEAFLDAATRAGIAAFPSIHRAARTVSLVLEWRARREGLPAIL
jgi:hypothetical protein